MHNCIVFVIWFLHFSCTIFVIHGQQNRCDFQFLGNCYLISDEDGTFLEAQAQCFGFPYGQLASVHSAFENQFLLSITRNVSQMGIPLWLGGYHDNSNNSNSWLWNDATNFNYANWDSGYPTQYEDEKFLAFNSLDGRWRNIIDGKRRFVCQFPQDAIISSTPNPNNPCTNGFTLLPDGGCYFLSADVHEEWKNFDAASADCQARQSELVSLHSFYDNIVLYAWFTERREASQFAWDYAWLGLRCADGTEATCQWTDGTAFDYSNFNGSLGSRFEKFVKESSSFVPACVAFSTIYAQFIPVFCNAPFHYICKQKVMQIPPVVEIPSCNIGFKKTRNTNLGDCFRVLDWTSDWDNCEAHCQLVGAQCTSIHSVQEDYAIFQLVYNTMPAVHHNYGYYIGLKEFNDHTFAWTDATRVDYANWAPGFPYVGGSSIISTGDSEEVPVAPGKWANSAFGAIPVCRQKALNQRDPSVCPYAEYFTMGEIRSPEYPNNYSSISDCIYTLHDRRPTNLKQPRYKIAIYFIDFFIGMNDTVSIYDGNSTNAELIARYTNTEGAKQHLYSTGNSLTVSFTSLFGSEHRGWRAVFGTYEWVL